MALTLALGLGVHPRAVRAARNLASRQARGEVGWAPQLRELLAFREVQRVLGEEAAVANLLGLAPPEDRDVVAEASGSPLAGRSARWRWAGKSRYERGDEVSASAHLLRDQAEPTNGR